MSLQMKNCKKFICYCPRLFEEMWRDIVFGFPWCVTRGCGFVVDTFSGQLLLQFKADPFEIVQVL